jgi:hypothetical protein
VLFVRLRHVRNARIACPAFAVLAPAGGERAVTAKVEQLPAMRLKIDQGIDIGNVGVANESNTIRIGDSAIRQNVFLGGNPSRWPGGDPVRLQHWRRDNRCWRARAIQSDSAPSRDRHYQDRQRDLYAQSGRRLQSNLYAADGATFAAGPDTGAGERYPCGPDSSVDCCGRSSKRSGDVPGQRR